VIVSARLISLTGIATHLLLLMCFAVLPARAQGTGPGEYRVKAAFLYNFAKFVEWPGGRSVPDSTPFIIGVFGPSPFRGELDEILRDKMVGSRAIDVRLIHSVEEALACQILFVAGSAGEELPQLLSAVEGKGVLTVGDAEDFADRGTVISFMIQDGKIRFSINTTAAAAAGLRISSKLLNLAQIISSGGSL